MALSGIYHIVGSVLKGDSDAAHIKGYAGSKDRNSPPGPFIPIP